MLRLNKVYNVYQVNMTNCIHMFQLFQVQLFRNNKKNANESETEKNLKKKVRMLMLIDKRDGSIWCMAKMIIINCRLWDLTTKRQTNSIDSIEWLAPNEIFVFAICMVSVKQSSNILLFFDLLNLIICRKIPHKSHQVNNYIKIVPNIFGPNNISLFRCYF